MTIDVNLFDPTSVQHAAEQLQAYADDLQNRANEICRRLADLGAERASVGFSEADYDGTNDVRVSVEPIENGYAVHASGNAVLFIEFGAGVTRGYGHPRPEGYGPGTYPGKGHWNDPKGWYYAHGQKSWGNPPAAAMYYAEQEVAEAVQRVAEEVLNR